MSDTLAKAFTLVIPTYNRPILLNGLLNYLQSNFAKFQILILDSSSPEFKAQNRDVVSQRDLNMRHVEFDETTPFLTKINSQLRDVRTDYVSLCADDNLVLLDAIERNVETLNAKPDAIACHGLGLELILSGKRARLNIDNMSPSIDSGDLVGRIYQLLKDFQSTIYATYRTEYFRRVLVESEQFKDLPFHWELFVTLAVLGGGKVMRLDCASNVRRSMLPAVPTQWHPVPLICENPDKFISDFVHYRDELIKFYSSQGHLIDAEQKKLITQAHLVYFANEARNNDILRETIAGVFSRYAARRKSGPNSATA